MASIKSVANNQFLSDDNAQRIAIAGVNPRTNRCEAPPNTADGWLRTNGNRPYLALKRATRPLCANCGLSINRSLRKGLLKWHALHAERYDQV